MGPARIKTGNRISLFIGSYRILRLIAVTKGFLHSYNRLHAGIYEFGSKTAYTNQVIADFLVFKCQLLLLGDILQIEAAALSVIGAFWLYTKRRRLYHLL